jgi:hypothetical protein
LESLDWIRYTEMEGKYFTPVKDFNGCKYYLYISVYENSKSDKFWVSISSGKKKVYIFWTKRK